MTDLTHYTMNLVGITPVLSDSLGHFIYGDSSDKCSLTLFPSWVDQRNIPNNGNANLSTLVVKSQKLFSMRNFEANILNPDYFPEQTV